MADRTVSVALRAQVGDFVAEMKLAGAAVDEFNRKVQGSGRRTSDSFQGTGRTAQQSAAQISASFGRVGDAAASAAARVEEQNARAVLSARRMGIAAQQAAERAAEAQKLAADAAAKLAAGEIKAEEAAKLKARADREMELASIKAAEADLAAGAATRKLSQDASDNEKSVTRMRGMLASAGAAAAGMSVPLGAAGAAALGMAAIAVPSITKVIAAQEDLATNWSTLDRGQKVAASSVSNLVKEYKDLAKSYEPDALALFNGVVGTTRSLLPELTATVDETKGALTSFANRAEETIGREVPRLFTTMRAEAAPALQQLGTTFDETTHLAVSLVQDLAPMGETLLSGANGVLGLLNALERLDPRLVEIGATFLAVRGPANALAGLWERGSAGLSRFGKTAAEAEKSTSMLGRTVSESPNIYLGAALAVSMLSWRWATAKDALDHRIESIHAEASATMNSTTAHQAAIKALGEESIGWASYNHQLEISDKEARKHDNSRDMSLQKVQAIAKAIGQEQKAVANITKGESLLSQQYGVTADQAGRLATAAGVDLATSMTKSGQLTATAAEKIKAYQQAVAAAQNPTYAISQALADAGNDALLMKDRVAALQTAFGALAGPELAAFDATTKTAQAFAELGKAMKASHGSMDLTTAKGQSAREALTKVMAALQQNIDMQYQYDSATRGAEAATQRRTEKVRGLLPVLIAEAHGNAEATNSVLAWANSAGVGRSRSEALAGALETSRAAFLSAAKAAGISRGEALKLWSSFKKLEQPTKLNVDDRQFLTALHNAQGLRLDPKTGLLLGNNSDYLNKWLRAKGLRIDPKTGYFRGNNSDYYNKWLRANGLRIDPKTGVIRGNTAAFWAAVHALPSSVGTRYIDVIQRFHTSYDQGNANKRLNYARGGLVGYARGGLVTAPDGGPAQRLAGGGPSGLVTGPGTGTSDSILTALSNREYVVNAAATAKNLPLLEAINSGLAPGPSTATLVASAPGSSPAVSTAAAGMTTSANPLELGNILQQWQDAVKPATKSDVNKAIKDRKTQLDQLRNAEDALARARRRHDPRAVAAAERKVRKEREDLADATKKLHDVENRYKYARQSPATQLGSALALNIKNTGAFMRNLQTLSDRGFGALAQQLLAMGGPQAEKIAADAVKMSSSKLKTLNSQIGQAAQQQQQLANMPAILNTRSAIKAGKGASWVGLLEATGLTPDVLAVAVKSMLSDLNKTAQGRALIADMHAHGYAGGGLIGGVGGPTSDSNLIRASRGEFMVNARSTAKYRPWVEAINNDTFGQFVRHLVAGGSGGRVASAAASSAAAGPVVHQTFNHPAMDVHELARESAREAAWALSA